MGERLGKGVAGLFKRDAGIPTPSIPDASAPASSIPDASILEDAVDLAVANPRITVYSPVAKAVLRYLASTVPLFNQSSVSAKMIERSLKREHPAIWKRAEAEIAKKRGGV